MGVQARFGFVPSTNWMPVCCHMTTVFRRLGYVFHTATKNYALLTGLTKRSRSMVVYLHVMFFRMIPFQSQNGCIKWARLTQSCVVTVANFGSPIDTNRPAMFDDLWANVKTRLVCEYWTFSGFGELAIQFSPARV